MSQFLLGAAVALTVGAIIFGVTVLLTGDDPGLRRVDPDTRAAPLPADRPLVEDDFAAVRFDTVARGYRMAQVDAALRRAAYDVGYKDELVRVLQAEVEALRAGRMPEAETLRRTRDAALARAAGSTAPAAETPTDGPLGEGAPFDDPAEPAASPPPGPDAAADESADESVDDSADDGADDAAGGSASDVVEEADAAPEDPQADPSVAERR